MKRRIHPPLLVLYSMIISKRAQNKPKRELLPSRARYSRTTRLERWSCTLINSNRLFKAGLTRSTKNSWHWIRELILVLWNSRILRSSKIVVIVKVGQEVAWVKNHARDAVDRVNRFTSLICLKLSRQQRNWMVQQESKTEIRWCSSPYRNHKGTRAGPLHRREEVEAWIPHIRSVKRPWPFSKPVKKGVYSWQ